MMISESFLLAVWKNSLDNCRCSTCIPCRTAAWNVMWTLRWRRSRSPTPRRWKRSKSLRYVRPPPPQHSEPQPLHGHTHCHYRPTHTPQIYQSQYFFYNLGSIAIYITLHCYPHRSLFSTHTSLGLPTTTPSHACRGILVRYPILAIHSRVVWHYLAICSSSNKLC